MWQSGNRIGPEADCLQRLPAVVKHLRPACVCLGLGIVYTDCPRKCAFRRLNLLPSALLIASVEQPGAGLRLFNDRSAQPVILGCAGAYPAAPANHHQPEPDDPPTHRSLVHPVAAPPRRPPGGLMALANRCPLATVTTPAAGANAVALYSSREEAGLNIAANDHAYQ